MGKQGRIGIYFNFGSNWLGGVYYLINLVNAFNSRVAEGAPLPTFIIFFTSQSESFLKLFTYPNIEFIRIPDQNLYRSYLLSWVKRENVFLPKQLLESNLDVLYPLYDFPVRTKVDFQLISWYPDLQHRFYPQYFGWLRWRLREFRLKLLLRRTGKLVCSSEDVLSHFQQFYADILPATSVLPFVSLVDVDGLPAEEDVRARYQLTGKYFIVSNQFYEHKDHLTVVRAIIQLKKSKEEFQIIMTGKMPATRKGYVGKLHDLLEANNLEDRVRFLGVIPRNDQLALLKYALSVVQPSKFEGWSTVVEDVKAIRGSILASDIKIHKEQLGDQGLLFEAGNYLDLAAKMLELLTAQSTGRTSFNYDQHVIEFTRKFEKLSLG